MQHTQFLWGVQSIFPHENYNIQYLLTKQGFGQDGYERILHELSITDLDASCFFFLTHNPTL